MRRKMHLTEADSKYFPAFHEGISASRGDNWLGPAAYKDCVRVCSVACGRNALAASLRLVRPFKSGLLLASIQTSKNACEQVRWALRWVVSCVNSASDRRVRVHAT